MKNIAYSIAILFFLTSSVALLLDAATPNEFLIDGDMEIWTNPATLTHWTLAGAGATLNREGAIKKAGKYSAELVRGSETCSLYQRLNGETYQGKTITFGAWVYATTAISKLQINYGNPTTYVDYQSHSGSGWEYLTVTATIGATATDIRCYLYNVGSGTESVYFDRATVELLPKTSSGRKSSSKRRSYSRTTSFR